VLPILSKLKQPEKVGFRAVIVSPTRELAQQIYRELRKLSKGKEFRICVLTKANANENSFSSTTRFDILVTTPMRLVHLLRNESLKLDSVQHLVLDEADKLLDMGFMEQVDEIIAACTNQAVQRSLWSATMSPIVEDLARTFLRDPVHLTIGTRDAATTTIKQRLEFVGREEGKLLMLRQMVTQVGPPRCVSCRVVCVVRVVCRVMPYVACAHTDPNQTNAGHQASGVDLRAVEGQSQGAVPGAHLREPQGRRHPLREDPGPGNHSRPGATNEFASKRKLTST